MCWMLTNLAYAGGGNNTFGDVVDWLQEGTQSDALIPLFARPPDANPTAFPAEPSTATDGGVNLATAQFGYLYNWCAAMGNQPTACQIGTMFQPDQSISICPAGWRLPTGQPNTGEFVLLNNAVNNGNIFGDAGLRNNWLGMWGGAFFNDSFIALATTGVYWSSTVNAAGLAFVISFGATWAAGDNTGGTETGFAVRCVADTPFIQDVTLDNCPLERTMVRDARDNRTYWIRRIPNTRQGGGDLCWMETNLAYAGDGNNRFGDVMPIGTTPGTLTAGTSSPGVAITGISTGTGQVCRGDNATLNTFGRGCFWEPVGSNPTTSPTAPSLSTDGTGQFGFLYNWCAAMGGQTAACQTEGAITPTDPAINICPAGWRLPTGDQNIGEFTLLNNAVNASSDFTDAGLRTNWLGMRSGSFSGSVFSGVSGNYWSSNAFNVGFARFLGFSAGWVNLTNVNSRGLGYAIRCVRE